MYLKIYIIRWKKDRDVLIELIIIYFVLMHEKYKNTSWYLEKYIEKSLIESTINFYIV